MKYSILLDSLYVFVGGIYHQFLEFVYVSQVFLFGLASDGNVGII